jgi:predicted lipoprotein with Yx(FWY)xxD motif
MVKGRSPILARMIGAVAAVAVVVCGVAAGSSGRVVVTSARNSELGEIQILVSANGHTLYRSSRRTCTGACAVTWLPLVVPKSLKPRAGADVSAALLGRVRRSDGRWQVTYHGTPLYLFSGDKKAGQVNGQGLDGVWHAITPRGVTVMKTVSTTSSQSTSSTSGSQGTSSPPMSSGSGSGSGSTGGGAGSSAGAGMFCAANPKSCVNGVPVTPTTTTAGG